MGAQRAAFIPMTYTFTVRRAKVSPASLGAEATGEWNVGAPSRDDGRYAAAAGRRSYSPLECIALESEMQCAFYHALFAGVNETRAL